MTTIVRLAGAADLEEVVSLVRERDGIHHPARAIAGYFADLDPERIAVWVAETAGEAVGLNAIYLRRMHAGEGTVQAGYWAHLYVRPEARKAMVYPRLVLAMLAWAREHGLAWVYTATRRPDVAAAHQKLGFEKIATIPVLLKPLRPAALLCARLTGAAALRSAAAAVDTVWGWSGRSMAAAGRLWSPPLAPDESGVWESPSVCRRDAPVRGTICSAWTNDTWAARFAATIEGDHYHAFVLPSASDPVAGLMVRTAERGTPSIRLGVVMDIFDSSTDARFLPHLHAAAVRWAAGRRAHALIALAPTDPVESRAFAGRGYMRSPERYALLAKATSPRPLPVVLHDAARWRFPFVEHDAF